MSTSTKHQAWKGIVKRKDLSAIKTKEPVFNIISLNIIVNITLANAGTICHVIILRAPINNVMPKNKFGWKNLPEGNQTKSTHKYEGNEHLALAKENRNSIYGDRSSAYIAGINQGTE